MKTKLYRHKRGGYTYFATWGFSINEGQFPNIHMSWRRWGEGSRRTFYFYVGICRLWGRRMRLHFNI